MIMSAEYRLRTLLALPALVSPTVVVRACRRPLGASLPTDGRSRILQLCLLLLVYCNGLTSGSWWRIADLSLDAVHFHRDNRSFELCGDTSFFTPQQRDKCYDNPELLKVIVHAANTAKYECQTYFQNNRWNCSAKRGNAIFYGNFDDKGNRETAYLSAINSASLAWTITRYCTKGELTTCHCDHIQRKKHSKWTWGGCSEDINHGIKQARLFTDPQENRTSSFGLMNLHNNEAARRILRSKMEKVCKCHGMSGSCTTRVCWRRLPSMKLIADTLGSMFDAAAQVKPVENKGIIKKLMRKDLEYKKVNKSDLVYIAESPNYCEENESLGIFSTRGRFCNRTSYGIEGCRLLCCGRGYQTRVRNVEEKCNCKFVWCCSVKCDTCSMRKDEHICN
ncbi:protein Wnt-1-like [Anopheles aquasalis]|uniref:protein Wnt-1-like n=1 Tax=Anopheles aquasalis TaxID=42839 RepID=UPI00215A1682|nr:protein Wnt-1-like [Anopheles aquasalis]